MAIHRRPPHPLRGPLILLVLLLVLLGAIVAISRSADEVPTRPVEVDVARDQPN
jgi:hypothetical protein